MNSDKARDYFSAYFEGTLDKGLTQSLESQFSSDSGLRADYEAFKATLSQLEALSKPVPEPDFDLHERIMSRLDRHIWEQDRKAAPKFAQWWRSLAIGGIATVALVGTLLQLNSKNKVVDPEFSTSGIVNQLPAGQLKIVEVDERLDLLYKSVGNKRVDIHDATGTLLKSTKMSSDEVLRSPLTNKHNESLILRIDVQGDDPTFISIPGLMPSHRTEATATVGDFALAISDHFRIPVALHHVDISRQISWKFASMDAFETVQKQLSAESVNIEKRDGVIWIIGQ